MLALVLGFLLVATGAPAAVAAPSAGTSTAPTAPAAPAATVEPESTAGSTAPAACASPGSGFADDLGGFGPYVEWMIEECIAQGYRDGTFRVHRPVTRAEAATFLYRMSGASHRPADGKPFSDVASTDVHYPAVMWARSRGITHGYADGSFGRDREITRGELAAIMYRYAGEPPMAVDGGAPFLDLDGGDGEYYFVPAAWMKGLGVTGYRDGTFRPDRSVSRGETGKFLQLVDSAAQEVVAQPRWTETRLDLYAEDNWLTGQVLATLSPQTRVEWIRDSEDLALVRTGGITGWVNKNMLSSGQPGTTATPFPNPATFEQKVANNIAPWCWAPQITQIAGPVSYANMRFQYRGSGDRYLVNKEEDLQITSEIPDADHVASKAIQLHECAHLLQYRAYGYVDAVALNGQELSAMDRDLNRVYGNENGVEHMADCMADAMGAQRVSDDYVVGYNGECSAAHRAAAEKLIAGERFSEPTVLNTAPDGRAVPFSPWQDVSRSDVPVHAVGR